VIAQFAIVWDHRDLLVDGFLTTLWLAALSAAASMALGAALAAAMMSRHELVARASGVLVDAMRCVPFLLFAYIVYYGLPSIGLRFSNWSSGLVALIVYNTAYMAELVRGAWRGLPAEMIEAGHAFGFQRLNLFRRIILPPVIFAAIPMIGNQVIQIIKDSAFLTIIALPELTHAASSIQSRHYVPFAAFITAVFLYWGLCLVIEAGVSSIGRVAEARR